MVLKRVQSLCSTSYGIPIQTLCIYGLANAKGDTSQLKLVKEKGVPHILTSPSSSHSFAMANCDYGVVFGNDAVIGGCLSSYNLTLSPSKVRSNCECMRFLIIPTTLLPMSLASLI
jgi:hypothetical protein